MKRRGIWHWVRIQYRRGKRILKYRVLHVDDTPHRIALGMGIGFFVTWTPTVGFQMALVVALCTLFRANKFVGVPFVWISNPATIVPIYYPNYWLGVHVTPGAHMTKLADWNHMVREVFGPGTGWWDRVSGFWSFMGRIAVPLWVGSLIVAVVVGIVAYWLTYAAVVNYRKRFGHAAPIADSAQAGHPGQEAQ